MSSKQNMKKQTEALTPSKSIASHKEMRNQIEKPSKTWDPQNFSTKTTLAKGTYSTIHLVQSPHTKKLYAVKARHKSLIEQNSETKFIHTEKDVVVLAKRENHPFVMEVFGGFETPTHILLYLEFCEGGSLGRCLQEAERFGVERTRFYVAEICLALKWLHEKSILYRALSLNHTLLASDGHVKLIDFVVSKVGLEKGGRTGSFCGQMEFMAPEILLDKEYDTAVDWWQLGIMTYQMLTQSSPFKGEDQDDVFDSILSDEVAFPEFVMGESIIFVKGLMEKEPDKRLGSGGNGAEEVMAHAFFDGIDWDDIYNKRVEVPFVPGLRDLVGISQGRSAFSHSKMEMVAGQVEELIPEAQDLFGGFGFSVD